MYRTGVWVMLAGIGLAVLSGFVYLSRNAEPHSGFNAAPYVVWASVGGVVLICGTVLYAAGRVLGELRPESSAGRTTTPSKVTTGSRSHYE